MRLLLWPVVLFGSVGIFLAAFTYGGIKYAWFEVFDFNKFYWTYKKD